MDKVIAKVIYYTNSPKEAQEKLIRNGMNKRAEVIDVTPNAVYFTCKRSAITEVSEALTTQIKSNLEYMIGYETKIIHSC